MAASAVLADLKTALDASNLTFSTGGAAEWFEQTSFVNTGTSAARSGAIPDEAVTWIETTVKGRGEFSFSYALESEKRYDALHLTIDGKEDSAFHEAQYAANGQGWNQWTLSFPDCEADTTHTIRWMYAKDRSNSSKPDCAWLDAVKWAPKPAYTVTFEMNGAEAWPAIKLYPEDVDDYWYFDEPERDGYVFGGWYLDAAFTEKAEGEIKHSDHTLYAKWLLSASRLNGNALTFDSWELHAAPGAGAGGGYAAVLSASDYEEGVLDIYAEKGTAGTLTFKSKSVGGNASFYLSEDFYDYDSRNFHSYYELQGGDDWRTVTIDIPDNETCIYIEVEENAQAYFCDFTWTPLRESEKTKVTFAVNGGKTLAARDFPSGGSYGELPEPEWTAADKCDFRGWFLDPNFEYPVKGDSYVRYTDHTLYAKWIISVSRLDNSTLAFSSWELRAAAGAGAGGGNAAVLNAEEFTEGTLQIASRDGKPGTVTFKCKCTGGTASFTIPGACYDYVAYDFRSSYDLPDSDDWRRSRWNGSEADEGYYLNDDEWQTITLDVPESPFNIQVNVCGVDAKIFFSDFTWMSKRDNTKVTFVVNGGNAMTAQNFPSGGRYGTLPEPEWPEDKEESDFRGWFFDPEFKHPVGNYVRYTDHTIYAKWRIPVSRLDNDSFSFESSELYAAPHRSASGGWAACLSASDTRNGSLCIEHEKTEAGTLTFKYMCTGGSANFTPRNVNTQYGRYVGWDDRRDDSVDVTGGAGWQAISLDTKDGKVELDVDLGGLNEKATIYFSDFTWTPAREFTKVTFVTNGGKTLPDMLFPSGGSYCEEVDGKEYSLPTPEWTGEGEYEFDGWYMDPMLSVPLDTSYVAYSDHTLHAKWTRVEEEDELSVSLLDAGALKFESDDFVAVEGAAEGGGYAAALAYYPIWSGDDDGSLCISTGGPGTLKFKYRKKFEDRRWSEGDVRLEVDRKSFEVDVEWQEGVVQVAGDSVTIYGYAGGNILYLSDFEWTPAAESYTLTFVTNGGEEIEPLEFEPSEGYRYEDFDEPYWAYPEEEEEEEMDEEELLIDENREFAGWYLDEALTTPANPSDLILFANHTLYAKWRINVGVMDQAGRDGTFTFQSDSFEAIAGGAPGGDWATRYSPACLGAARLQIGRVAEDSEGNELGDLACIGFMKFKYKVNGADFCELSIGGESLVASNEWQEARVAVLYSTRLSVVRTGNLPSDPCQVEPDSPDGVWELLVGDFSWEAVPQNFTVSFVTNGGKAIEPITIDSTNSLSYAQILCREECQIEWAGDDEYHIFDGWFLDDAFTMPVPNYSLVPFQNQTLYAKWHLGVSALDVPGVLAFEEGRYGGLEAIAGAGASGGMAIYSSVETEGERLTINTPGPGMLSFKCRKIGYGTAKITPDYHDDYEETGFDVTTEWQDFSFRVYENRIPFDLDLNVDAEIFLSDFAYEPAPSTVEVTYATNGGNPIEPETFDCSNSWLRMSKVAEPTWSGDKPYRLYGWYLDEALTVPAFESWDWGWLQTFDANVTLYAKWFLDLSAMDTEDLRFDADSDCPGYFQVKEGGGVNGGNAIVLTLEEFRRWKINEDIEDEGMPEFEVIPKSRKRGTLTFKYRKVGKGKARFGIGEDGEYEVDAAEEWREMSWDGYCEFEVTKLESDAIEFCDFEWRSAPETIRVTFETNGTRLEEVQEYKVGEYYGVLPAPVRAGFEFLGWYEDGVFGERAVEYMSRVPSHDVTLVAKWGDSAIDALPSNFTLKEPAELWRQISTDGGVVLEADFSVDPWREPETNSVGYVYWRWRYAVATLKVDVTQSGYFSFDMTADGDEWWDCGLTVYLDGLPVLKDLSGRKGEWKTQFIYVPAGSHVIELEALGWPDSVYYTRYSNGYPEEALAATGLGPYMRLKNLVFEAAGPQPDLKTWVDKVAHYRSFVKGDLGRFAAEYKTRINADPLDYEARIFHALAIVAQLAESDLVREALDSFGLKLDYASLSLSGELRFDANSADVNDVADYALELAAPVIEEALEDLAEIPDDWSGMVKVTPLHWPVDAVVGIDAADVAYMRAALHGMLATVQFLASYDLTVDWKLFGERFPELQELHTNGMLKARVRLAVFEEQKRFLSAVRDAELLDDSRDSVRTALQAALKADAKAKARGRASSPEIAHKKFMPAVCEDGVMHFVEYDPLLAEELEFFRTNTRTALESLDAVVTVDGKAEAQWLASVCALRGKKDGGGMARTLANIGVADVYLGALFGGGATRRLLPDMRVDCDGRVVANFGSFRDPTFAGALPGCTCERILEFYRRERPRGKWEYSRVVTPALAGSGANVDSLRLAVGEPYGTQLDGLEIPGNHRAQTLAGWLVNGVPLSPNMIVGEDDVLTPVWALDNPLADDDAALDAAASTTYNGYVVDEDGVAAGTVIVKVGKLDKNREATVTASLQLLGQKKLTFKTKEKKVAILANAPTANVILAAKKAQSDIVLTNISKDGIVGKYDGYDIVAMRNDSRTNSAAYNKWMRTINVSLATAKKSASGVGAAFAYGYSTLNIEIGKAGKVKITGVMADGKKANAKAQLLVADDGSSACINVFVPMYAGKTGGFGFILWLAPNGSVSIESVSGWSCTDKKNAFTASFGKIASGSHSVPNGSAFEFFIDKDGIPAKLNGVNVLRSIYERNDVLPIGTILTYNGRLNAPKNGKVSQKKGVLTISGTGENNACVKINATAKTGALKGNFTFYTWDAAKRKLKKIKVQLNGAFVAGKGYGSATIKKVGSMPFTLE